MGDGHSGSDMSLWLFVKAYYLLMATVRLRRRNRISASAAHPTCSVRGLSAAQEGRILTLAQRAVRHAERMIPVKLNCLQRSVVLQDVLSGEGVVTQLQIGVRKRQGVLEAHAWLECRGVILNSSVAHCAAFQPLHAAIAERASIP